MTENVDFLTGPGPSGGFANPLAEGEPIITFYTPTFRRPEGLAACLASVGAQTASSLVEHLVIPDHVGRGIGGMYQEVPKYVEAVHGRYVHVLADDDVLADASVVEALYREACAWEMPPVIVVDVDKGGRMLPLGEPWPPREGRFDLGNLITRRDVWSAVVRKHGYGNRYEGDHDFANAVAVYLAERGWKPAVVDLLFMRGDVRHGVPEVGW